MKLGNKSLSKESMNITFGGKLATTTITCTNSSSTGTECTDCGDGVSD